LIGEYWWEFGALSLGFTKRTPVFLSSGIREKNKKREGGIGGSKKRRNQYAGTADRQKSK